MDLDAFKTLKSLVVFINISDVLFDGLVAPAVLGRVTLIYRFEIQTLQLFQIINDNFICSNLFC